MTAGDSVDDSTGDSAGSSSTGPPSSVDVWRIPLGPGVDDATLGALYGLLDAQERARARAASRPDLRRHFVLSHGATRLILGRRLGAEPGSLRFVRGRWGKPEVAGAGAVRFSLAHSGELALVAVTGSGRSVGVDVEAWRSRGGAGRLAARFFTPDEQERVTAAADAARVFTRLWARKEACVKSAGVRLADGLPVRVDRLGDGAGGTGHSGGTAHSGGTSHSGRTGKSADTEECAAVQSAVVTGPCGPEPGPWALTDLEWPDAGHAAAVALSGDGVFQVECHDVWFGEGTRDGIRMQLHDGCAAVRHRGCAGMASG
ncbi:4-phosphopantetheinyl transferase [Streptomyces triticagri]|uniref:4-phosphopantetheinyl transferase n=1 Tax=Streptomyces triticagri TaxID=2293568 RepID=A0A372LV22_9ACTN|nr:4'-phosphopantetheinyl transferase superfamily protein [Streptomyces triticagri]RFU82514.1 4-phosphopantetheinyl transferase [Streptomyces triticagri]